MLSGSVGAKKKIERRGKALESKRESRERRWEPSLPQGYLKILHWGHLIEPFVIEASFHDTLCLQSMETLYMWVDECREYRVDVLPPRCLPSLIGKKVWYVLLPLRNVISISCLGHSMDCSPALAFSCACKALFIHELKHHEPYPWNDMLYDVPFTVRFDCLEIKQTLPWQHKLIKGKNRLFAECG